jgi:hypothetical protein
MERNMQQFSYLAFSVNSYLPFSVNLTGQVLHLTGKADLRCSGGTTAPP